MDIVLRDGRQLQEPTLATRYPRNEQTDGQRRGDIRSLAQAVMALEDALLTAKVDLEEEKIKKREYRRRAEDAESMASRNQFALVLVDGNGYIFKEAFFRDAFESGGSRAASRLHDEIQNYLRAHVPLPHTSDIEVMVNVYANKSGLTKTLLNAGMIDHSDALDKFFQSFTCGKRLFHFIDCGPGKERVDAKLRDIVTAAIDTYRFYACIRHCHYIFLACCHDNGYVAEFDKYRDHSTASTKTILVQAARPASEYASLSFPVVRLGSIFETSAPPTSWPVSYPHPQSAVTPTRMTPTSQKLMQPPAITCQPTATDTYASRSSMTLPRVPVVSPGAVSISNVSKKVSVHHPNTFQKASAMQTAHSRDIPVNRAGCRIDRPLCPPSKQQLVRFEVSTRLCNDHHLRNNCNRQNCEYSHETIDAEMMKTLRYKARKFSCVNGSRCRRADCYHSHHCPSGNECSHPNCIYSKKGMHDIGDLEIAGFETAK